MMRAPIFSRIGPLRARSGRFPGHSGLCVDHVARPVTADEEGMPYFARFLGRDSHRRRALARHQVEALEGRTMLSTTAASLAAADVHISSKTALQTSLTTAITGTKVTFTASVDDAATDVPISSGKVSFEVEGPKKVDLSSVTVTKQGLAGVTTNQLTTTGEYRIKAAYTPTNSKISASAAAPVDVKVIPQPVEVPTTTTLISAATMAETGQPVPLKATVADAGTGDQIDAGTIEKITGKVEFFSDSPDPFLLGTVKLTKKDTASLPTKMLKNAGPYQIHAVYVPGNKDFTTSTSAPIPVTITPATVNAPTVTSIQAIPSTIETGEGLTLTATVQNANSSLPDGVVEFTTVGRHPVVLNTVPLSNFGEQVGIATSVLQKVGFHEVQAKYLPNTNRFAKSLSAPVTIAITPLTAVAFRVTPVIRHGQLNKPLSFEVTALNDHHQPLTNYTGTVLFTSPTDSSTIFPPAFYTNLHISASPPATGLAVFPLQSYTFTAADQGSHTFVGGVTFGKAGAENIQVTQASNPEVQGKATFSIE
jgi:hypothetical protein